MPDEQSYLGTGWSFPPTFDKSARAVEMSSGVEDVEESLAILLSTQVGERVMQPRYGCNMDRLLFEPLDTALQTYMEDLIETAILYFEPRIVLDGVHLDTAPEEGVVYVTVDYTIPETNARYNFVYPFYKEEGVDIPERMIGRSGYEF